MKDNKEFLLKVLCIILVILAVIEGCSDTLAMRNCFYVIIPYILEVILICVLIARLVRLRTTTRPDIEKKIRNVLPGITFFLGIFGFASVVCLVIFLLTNRGNNLTGLWQYPFLICANAAIGCIAFKIKKICTGI